MVLREGLYVHNGQRTEKNDSRVHRLLPQRAPIVDSLAIHHRIWNYVEQCLDLSRNGVRYKTAFVRQIMRRPALPRGGSLAAGRRILRRRSRVIDLLAGLHEDNSGSLR